MLSPTQLLQLAVAYGQAEGVGLGTIGRRACGNNKALPRLAAGRGVTTTTVAALERFFRNSWPAGAIWPADVPDPPNRITRRRRAACPRECAA